ncbi:F-box domain containing protein [Pandoravirus celtis]|uniref:F-box domain containing protein n=1 Tax=Pandoravirus celtis TaxID=2568002 RepID=A0A4D6EKA1_9VIRU|nr:F-box domain containing protein [Pandoravirus celtis]
MGPCTQETCRPGLDTLANELVVEILVRLSRADNIGRCALLSKRFADLIARDARQYVWRRATERAARLVRLDGPWLAFAASTQGWVWVRRALDTWTPFARGGIGFLRKSKRTYMGEYRADKRHGHLVEVVTAGGWAFYGPVGDYGASHGSWFSANGNVYRGQSRGGQRHGIGTLDNVSDRTRVSGHWWCGQRHGTMTVVGDCACPTVAPDDGMDTGVAVTRDVGEASMQKPPPPSVDPAVSGTHGTVFTRAFGYVMKATYLHGRHVGRCTYRYCNGDFFDCDYGRQGSDIPVSERMVLSPHCPDPKFRAVEIKADVWRHQTVGMPGGVTSTLSYPDPVQSPDMFRIYHDYFKAGFLPVRECQRAAVAAILAREALWLGM